MSQRISELMIQRLYLWLIVFLSATPAVWGQGTTAFQYQGQLKLDGKPTSGLFDFEFTLFDGLDPFIANPIGDTSRHLDVEVENGIFEASVDFGPGVFDGQPLWLRICVRDAGDLAGLTCLLPLQQITPVPYSTFAVNASELDGLDSDDFLRRTSGCQICIGHADSFGTQPTREQCFGLTSSTRSNGNYLQFSGDVDENDRMWLWMECP